MLKETEHTEKQTPNSLHTVTQSLDEPSNEDLMKRIKGREERALEILIKRLTPILRSIVGGNISNDQDVTDVVEEVFLGVWNQAQNFDTTQGKALGWIFTMARRRAIDRVRRHQAYDRAEMRFRLSTETGTSHLAGDDVGREADKSDTAAIFEKLLLTLPEAQSAVVRMAFYRGLSQREIARDLNQPYGTVKTRLELGIKKLRAAISKMGPRESWLVTPPDRKASHSVISKII